MSLRVNGEGGAREGVLCFAEGEDGLARGVGRHVGTTGRCLWVSLLYQIRECGML